MENNVLPAATRSGKGKGTARKLRVQEKIPGVFYFGAGVNIPLTIDFSAFRDILKKNPNLINLEIEGEEPHECIIREIQRDPVDSRILHVDLMGVKRGQKLIVTIPVSLIGIPEGVKTSGGILQKGLAELDIECLPKHIPTSIEVDVSELEIGQAKYIEDLDLPDFRFLLEEKVVLASVVPPTVVKEPVTEEEEDVEGVEGEEGEEKEAEGEGKDTGSSEKE